MKIICCVMLPAILLMAGCGTVSKVESTSDKAILDASRYSKVVVLDFENGVPIKSNNAEKALEREQDAGVACRLFADKIAAELRKQKLFAEVVRGPSGGEALVIYGWVTRYQEGNAAARLLIGLGAGSSYFDADVRFKDNSSGNDLALMKVDKNSWVLGGGIAATQTVEGYMELAARKIARQLSRPAQERGTAKAR